MKSFIRISFVLLIIASCTPGNKDLAEQYKKEIVKTEGEFAEMAMSEGVAGAFLHYAADDAVLNRNGIIPGKDSIRAWFGKVDYSGIKLEWEPEFVDVSKSGDLGYTYGYYTITRTDSSGKTDRSTGIFHTVWKRQPDGEWRFVWD